MRRNQVGFVESFLVLFNSLLALGLSVEPKTKTTKILCFSICMTGALAFWSYSAALISFMTVEKSEYPIKTLEVHDLFCCTKNLERIKNMS